MKKILVGLMTVVAALGFAGCSGEDYQHAPLPLGHPAIAEWNGHYLSVVDVHPDQTGLHLTKTVGDNYVNFNSGWYMEVYQDGIWRIIPNILRGDDGMSTLTLPPNTIIEHVINWGSSSIPEPGRYRIVRAFWEQGGQHKYLYAEFIISR